MLTHSVSKALWSKLAKANSDWLMANKHLLAKCALTVYRKCGKPEAVLFIALLRASMLVDIGA